MPFYQRQGDIPPKRHTQFRSVNGALRFEELFSTQGFGGPYSLLYHETFPVEVLRIEPGGVIDVEEWRIDSQQNRLFDTNKIQSTGDILTSRRLMAYNEDVAVSIAYPDRACDSFFRNGLCDELIMVAEGSGEVLSPFGRIPYCTGDMIVIPRGTTYDFRPGTDRNQLLILESRSAIAPPKRYLVTAGQIAEHSPFCERDLKTPQLQEPIVERGEFRIVSKLDALISEYIVPNHPCDVVGWDGSLYPFAMNISDFEPVTRRIHTMPDEQQVFETAGAAVCCMVPRLADYHPNSIPAPPLHSNIDCDEILFNVGGALLGWKGSVRGTMTIHPRGLFHAAKAYEETIGMKTFEGTALMIDAFKPLKLTTTAERCSDPSYFKVWSKK